MAHADPGHDAGLSRRRFLLQGLGGLTAASLSAPAGALETRVDAAPRVRVDPRHEVFNGQDLGLARFLESSLAPARGEHAALVRAGAQLAEALAWALAPSGAAEVWRLDELARRGGPDLTTSDDPTILRDRAEAEGRFRDALGVVGAEAAGSLRPLGDVRRYTVHRYLRVRELFDAAAAAGEPLDLVVPAMAPEAFEPGLAAPPTPLGDQVLAVAGIVRLCAGRVHPLVPFEPQTGDAFARVRHAVEDLGFLGVAARRPDAGLRDWCERNDVPLVMRGARAPANPGDEGTISFLGLRRGRRTRDRLERFYERHGMAAPRWMRAVDGAAPGGRRA